MPTSATGNSGFTLVELLVVLVIVGLLASVVVLTLPGGGDLRADAQALAARVKLASQESILEGVPTGLRVTPEGYAFYSLRDGVWSEVTSAPAFQRRTWRAGVAAELMRTANTASTGPDRKVVVPDVVFDPTGMASPFTVSLSESGARFAVEHTAKGEVVVRDTP